MEALQALNLPEQEWTPVPPFKPSRRFSQDQKKRIRERLDGIGAEPESADLILSRTAPSFMPALVSYLTTIGAIKGESGWTDEDEAMFQIENVGAA